MKIPDTYAGREQAFVKHTILRSYLQRLFMIIGQGKAPVINYVDCFAGPWQENDQQLRDTSIGISLEQIAACKEALSQMGHEVHFRALYIEKNKQAFKRLESFLSHQPYPQIETGCLHGDYTSLIPDILAWREDHFTFFFVDPKGWKNIGSETLKPLLALPESEFLINLMYDFLNRFTTWEALAPKIEEVLGAVPDIAELEPAERQTALIQQYRQSVNSVYRGRTTFVPIEKPGVERNHYFLIYLTRNATGLSVFKDEAQKLAIIQQDVQQQVRFTQRMNRTGMGDLFGAPEDDHVPFIPKLEARDFLLSKLSHDGLKIDNERWADFLEESDLMPGDLQAAMLALVKEGLVENIDADVSRRRRKPIHPAYASKSERWRLTRTSK